MSFVSDLLEARPVRSRRRTFVLVDSFTLAALAADALAIIAASTAAGVLYHTSWYGEAGSIADFISIGLLMALFYTTLQAVKKTYDVRRIYAGDHGFFQIFAVWNMALLGLFVVAFLAKTTAVYSRGAVVLFYGTGLTLVWLTRVLISRLVHWGVAGGHVATSRVLLVGTADRVAEFEDRYRPAELGYAIVDTIHVPSLPVGQSLSTSTLFAQALRRAVTRSRQFRADDVFVLIPWSDAAAIEQAAETFMAVPAAVHLAPEAVLDRFSDVSIAKIGPLSSLNLVKKPMEPLQVFIKRAFDIVAAAAGLIVLTPLFAVAALAIKLDSPGPVFFRQRRHGFNQEMFHILKFRSMTTADDGAVIKQATRNDPRITRVGRWLRTTNIDELPQLLNVLKGEMSIVGPRPHALAHNRSFQERIALYARRHNVKPGITGWAQVNGFRGETDTDEKMRDRVKHDLYYIDNWSLGLDLYIMMRTVLTRTAYRNAV